MDWFALYTKPRNEKAVAEKLEALGIETYCPMVTTIKQWSDRKKKTQTPLLPSYVFVKMEDSNRKQVFLVSGVVQFVFWLGKPAIIRPQEIEALKDQLSTTVTKVVIETWKPNTTVQLKEGPFKDQMAFVDKISSNKVSLILTSLGIRLVIER
jgi:transcription antitermination factor NusG